MYKAIDLQFNISLKLCIHFF